MTFTVSEDQMTAVLTDGALTLRLIAKNSIDCGGCALRKLCGEPGLIRSPCCSAPFRRNRCFIIWEEVP